jgi:hypothetical protein
MHQPPASLVESITRLPPCSPRPPTLWRRLHPEQQRQLAQLVAELLRRRWHAASSQEVGRDE